MLWVRKRTASTITLHYYYSVCVYVCVCVCVCVKRVAHTRILAKIVTSYMGTIIITRFFIGTFVINNDSYADSFQDGNHLP